MAVRDQGSILGWIITVVTDGRCDEKSPSSIERMIVQISTYPK
jgi:hypothetical protein